LDAEQTSLGKAGSLLLHEREEVGGQAQASGRQAPRRRAHRTSCRR
jgi:hypothetical protein